MSGTSPNAILELIKGIAKVPGDTNSAEQGLDSINLLDPLGFSCDTYDIQLPNLKNSAVWADSSITDGRTLISGALGNVTETIRLELTAGTLVQMAAMLSKLVKFQQDCNDFWDTLTQIEPVYLKHQVEGEPGPRYALLYNIEINVESPITPGVANRTVTLSIEREFGWRGIAPGDNPKKWTIQNYFTGQTWDSADAALTTDGNHLLFQIINNRREWNTAQTAVISKNHVEIPAAAIPGDLEALCFISAIVTGASALSSQVMYIGRSSKPDLLLNTGATRTPNYILNAADGTGGTDATNAADTGAPRIASGGGGNFRVNISFATASDAQRVSWTGATQGYFDFSSNRGRFIALLRCRLSAAGTVTMHLGLTSGTTSLTNYPVTTFTEVGTGGTGNTTAWGMAYLGEITLPPSEERVIAWTDGLGVLASNNANWSLGVYAARTSGTPTLYISDLILIPIDEAAIAIDNGQLVTGFGFDNTGYTLHGKPGECAQIGGVLSAALSGTGITLKPKVINRLYFIETGNGGLAEIIPFIEVRINIVPRWSGLRDS